MLPYVVSLRLKFIFVIPIENRFHEILKTHLTAKIAKIPGMSSCTNICKCAVLKYLQTCVIDFTTLNSEIRNGVIAGYLCSGSILE